MLQFTPWRSAWCSENNSLRPSNCWRIARKICRKSQRRGSWSKETMHWVCDRESFKWLVQVFLTGLHLFERHVLFSTRILSHKMLSFKKVTTLANWECCILFRLRCACFFCHVLWQVVQVLKLLITAYFAKNDSEGDQKAGQQLHLPQSQKKFERKN